MRRSLLFLPFALACASNQPSAKEEPQAAVRPTCDDPTTFRAAGDEPIGAARRYVKSCGLAATSSLTATLVGFPTVRAREGKTGPAFVAMRRYLEKWSAANGFTFESFDDDPWVVSWGEGRPSVAFVMHADVVPVVEDVKAERPRVPPGWSVPPFEVTEKDGRLYGRGTEDDKAPIAAVLQAMSTLKKLGYQPRGKVQAILGTGEEHAWKDMVLYASTSTHAKFTVSIDANFPVVVAEAGFVAWRLQAPVVPKKAKKRRRRRAKCVEATSAKAGQFLTQVPGEAELVLSSAPANLKAAAAMVSQRENIRHEITSDGKTTTLKMFGRAVHSSVANEGENALWALAAVANELPLCEGGIKDLLRVVATYFDQDHWGEKLGVAYSHDVMGKLLVSPTMLRVEDGTATLSVNMRRPAGKDVDAFNAALDTALAKLQKETSAAIVEKPKGRYVGRPALAKTDGPLVETLLAVYREQSGDTNAKPTTIRGGTYARLFPGAVSFGPALPDHEYRGHAPDEYIEKDALDLMNRAVLEALVRLDELTGS